MAFGADVANLIVQLKLDDSGFTGKLNNAARTLGRMDQGLSRMGRGAGQVGAGLSRLGTVAAAAAAGGLAAVVTTAISFEDAFAGVRKTVDATDEQLEALNDAFRAMAREIPLSFEELAKIGEQAGALGIATQDIEEFTRVAALIGVTTDVSSEEAATALGQLSNVLKLTQEDYDNFGAALVDLGNKGSSTEAQILAIASRAGSAGKLLNLTTQDVLGWSSAAANLGIEVEAAGSSIQKFFLESLKNVNKDKNLERMAETAGVTGDAFKKAFEEDASGALIMFLEGLGKLDKATALGLLKDLNVNDIRITRLLLGYAGDIDNITDSLNTSSQAWKENTALTTEAEKRFATTQSQLIKLKNNLRDVGATIGSALLPVINELTKEFVEFLNKPGTQEGIVKFADDLANGIRGIAKELKGTDFSGLLSGLQVASSVAKVAFDAFRALPGPLQGAIIGAIALNKVSGGGIGLLVKGVSNIAFGGLQAGIAGIFGGRGTSPANPLFVSAIGGGLGGPGGVAGTAGKGVLANAGRLLGLAFVATAGVELGELLGKGLFFNPTVQPTVEIERSQFDQFIDRNGDNRQALEHGLDAVEDGIRDIINSPVPGAAFLARDQLAVLQQQRDLLKELIGRTPPTSIDGRTGRTQPKPGLGTAGETEAERAARQGAAGAKPMTAKEFLAALATTSEFGLKGIGTTIEQGVKTGLDPFGQNMLALAQRLKNPKDPLVLTEIKNHIIAAEEIQAQYLADGNTNAAKQVQATIDGLHELIGTEDDHNAIREKEAAEVRTNLQNLTAAAREADAHASAKSQIVSERIQSMRDSMAERLSHTNDFLGTIAAKDFSPEFNILQTVNVSATLSASEAAAAISINNTIRSGKGTGLINATGA